MKKISALLFLCFFLSRLQGQTLSLQDGWKFKIGDDAIQWKEPAYDDTGWKEVDLKNNWNKLGYEDHVGFGWYRKQVVIPSSMKEKSYLKDSIRFFFATVDDGDEVYLNGILIGRNGGHNVDIKDGGWGPRTYTIASDNPAIRWDKDNVLAVRVFNNNGIGGMYGNAFGIKMPVILEAISISNDGFAASAAGSISTNLEVKSLSSSTYDGSLRVTLTDPESNKPLSDNTVKGSFSNIRPYVYKVRFQPKERKSYKLTYTFTESKSGESKTAEMYTPYILTPAVKATPKINAPEIYGARISSDFFYKIPATGQQPLVYKATGLPKGLQLDAKTGIISGTTGVQGDYPVDLLVSNKSGTATKRLVIKIGDRIGLTPALGWNSWNAWGLSVSDEKVRISARAMAEKLAAHGWSYINIDDGWEAPQRGAQGEIVTNQKFPDMKALTDYVHGLGLKIGIYSSPGTLTCGGYLGSYEHELQDARTYAGWKIDYLKYDWCSYGDVAGKNPSPDALKKPYLVMRDALNKVNHDIIYSLCQYGMGDVYKWGPQVGGNSWRTTGDITDTWESMSRIGFGQAKCYPYSTDSGFIDPDMLIVGKVGWGPRLHDTRLSPDEQYFHISLWALLSSPLLIGCDMGQLDDFTLNLLTNDEVIAIDQDAKAIQAKQVLKADDHQVWIKQLASGASAVGIFNSSKEYKTITVKWSELGVTGYKSIRDVWRQKELGRFDPVFTVTVPPHGVSLLKLQ